MFLEYDWIFAAASASEGDRACRPPARGYPQAPTTGRASWGNVGASWRDAVTIGAGLARRSRSRPADDPIVWRICARRSSATNGRLANSNLRRDRAVALAGVGRRAPGLRGSRTPGVSPSLECCIQTSSGMSPRSYDARAPACAPPASARGAGRL